jgi:GT2 family glycosyltransferase
MSDRVTTVVITRDRSADLQRSLPHHRGPVILVDNGSTDDTLSMARRRHPDIELIAVGANLGAVGRNVGVQAARTEYVAFADDDSWWAPGALDLAAETFDRHPRLGLLAGRVLVGEHQRLDPICAMMADSPLTRSADLPGPSVLGFVACGTVVRRTAFLQAGGFDEVVEFAGEEERLALDLAAGGWGLAYVPEVVSHHHPSLQRSSTAARQTRLARNQLLTAVMRRPWSVVAATLLTLLSTGRPQARGIAAAVPRLRRASRRRRALPAPVEMQRRLLGL